jgi:cytochrome c nitrite reductase small subunit
MKRVLPSLFILFPILFGAFVGLGGYTFVYARGASYLTSDPRACVNCHIMRDQYSAWLKGSHRSIAGCNDCHAPSGFVGKYYTKAVNGFWHSFAFTTGRFPEKIRITERNLKITERRCAECHEDFVHQINATPDEDGRFCLRCHKGVGHQTQ